MRNSRLPFFIDSYSFLALVEKYSEDKPEEAKYKKINVYTQVYVIAVYVDHETSKEAIEYEKAKRLKGNNYFPY